MQHTIAALWEYSWFMMCATNDPSIVKPHPITPIYMESFSYTCVQISVHGSKMSNNMHQKEFTKFLLEISATGQKNALSQKSKAKRSPKNSVSRSSKLL